MVASSYQHVEGSTVDHHSSNIWTSSGLLGPENIANHGVRRRDGVQLFNDALVLQRLELLPDVVEESSWDPFRPCCLPGQLWQAREQLDVLLRPVELLPQPVAKHLPVLPKYLLQPFGHQLDAWDVLHCMFILADFPRSLWHLLHLIWALREIRLRVLHHVNLFLQLLLLRDLVLPRGGRCLLFLNDAMF